MSVLRTCPLCPIYLSCTLRHGLSATTHMPHVSVLHHAYYVHYTPPMRYISHTHTCVCICTYISHYIHTYIHTVYIQCTYTYIYTYIHTCMYTLYYIHTYYTICTMLYYTPIYPPIYGHTHIYGYISDMAYITPFTYRAFTGHGHTTDNGRKPGIPCQKPTKSRALSPVRPIQFLEPGPILDT